MTTSNYYEVKTTFFEPVEGSDEFKKITKTFLVSAVSVTDAEVKTVDWHPSNYRDFNVESIKKTSISEVKLNQEESSYLVKLLNDDDGRIAKPKPYFAIYSARDINQALSIAQDEWSGTEIEEVKKYKNIVDEDLVKETIPE